ncbi:hypothetical protein Cni_G23871 [Canna indica]|uniref:Non-specific serine/threonine protein kinase n=1 Tax=Canna indica TaxID=4628 RepID=A0AAQ3QP01_9LILI|nr:hypothetical protein Cni_G23871 [Canna indica]
MGSNRSIAGCYSFLFFLIIPTSIIILSDATDTLLPSQSLSDGQTLISANKTFEFGFFSPSNSSNRYVGIWYHKVPQQTVVWVANRDNPLSDTSGLLTFNKYGDLILLDGMKSSFKVAINFGTHNASVNILDSGNLILRSLANSSMIVWQSFDDPTDTFLPGMKLGLIGQQNRLLTSWKSYDDPARGDFSFGLNPTGEQQVFIWKRGMIFSTCRALNGEIFNTSDSNTEFKFAHEQDGEYFSYSVKEDSAVVRFIMSTSSQLQQLRWLESEETWTILFREPPLSCSEHNLCGAFGVCNELRPSICECLPGFQPAAPQDWFNGRRDGRCFRNNSLQCESGEKPDRFLKVPHINYSNADDADKLDASSAEECESACSRNCSCTAFAFSTGCLLWQGDLTNLVQIDGAGDSTVGTLYIRLAAADLQGKKGKLLPIVASVTVAITLVLCCLLVYTLWTRRHRGRGIKRFQEQKSLLFSLSNDVSFEIGESERVAVFLSFHFSEIEKGQLGDGQEIAVKRLSTSSGQGLIEFRNEIILIAKLQHRNLAWQLWKEGRWSELMDPSLGDGCAAGEVSRCIHVALMCVQENAGDRPKISDVITMLSSDNVALPGPKQPAFFFTVTTITEADHSSNLDIDCSLNYMTITNSEGR